MRTLLVRVVALGFLIPVRPVRADVLTGTIDATVYQQVGGIQLRLGKPIDLLGAIIFVRTGDVPRLLRSSAFNFGPGCSACIDLLSKTPPDLLTPHLHTVTNGRPPDLPEGAVMILLEFDRFSDVLAQFRPQTQLAPAANGAQLPPGPPSKPPNGGAPENLPKLTTEHGGCEFEHLCTDPNNGEVCATTKCSDLELEVCNSGVQINRSVSIGPIDITIHALPRKSSR